MSPLTRSLLALTCAALLRAACALEDKDQCTTLTIGKTSPYIVYTRRLGPMPIQGGEVKIDVVDEDGIELADEVVTVCVDVGLAPIVTPSGKSDINVRVDPWGLLVTPKLTMTVKQNYTVKNEENYSVLPPFLHHDKKVEAIIQLTR